MKGQRRIRLALLVQAHREQILRETYNTKQIICQGNNLHDNCCEELATGTKMAAIGARREKESCDLVNEASI